MAHTRADLVLVEQFLNTLDERTFVRHRTAHVVADGLTSVDALSSWLDAHGLVAPGEELGPSDLAAARSLRAALRQVLGRGPDSARVAEAMAEFPLTLAPDPSGRLRVVAAGGAQGLSTLLETVAVAVASGAWSRLKLCASDDCHWAFYDTSRSGGGRWCSMDVCGNRHKTRAYRQRHPD